MYFFFSPPFLILLAAFLDGSLRNSDESLFVLSVCKVWVNPTKVRLVKAVAFPVGMCGCESWAIKKAEH